MIPKSETDRRYPAVEYGGTNNVDNSADLPASVFTRPKMGFAVPIGDWLRGELRPMLHDTVAASASFTAAHLHGPTVQRLMAEHETSQVDHSQRLYALLMLELWWRNCGK